MTSFNAARVLALSVLLCMAAATCLAQPIASGDLEIRGMALEIVETSVSVEANTGTPSYVQTRFGGGTDDATVAGGFVAEGDLVGPGIDTPITLRTPPGHRFEIPGLPTEGEYYLQRVRLVRSDGTFLSDAIPSVASIRVSSMLLTEVKMRQLTSDELRARGIVLDSRNFECWQVTATFYVEGKAVVVEYPVVIDPTTREIRQVVGATPYNLPPIGNFTPPRWTPPAVVAFDLDEPVGDQLPSGSPTPFEPTRAKRSSIPAALVLSGNLAVLHQFFSVGLNVANGASPASTVRLEAVSARLRAPSQVRIAKTSPSVAPGQPVPLRTADGGSLEPQQQAAAEWTVEGLATGTHMLDVDVQATMTQPGQPDQVLSGTKSAAVVIHDPRFNISFAHPATVEAAVDWSSDSSVYSAWAFVTNTSPSQQTVGFSTGIPTCSGVPQHLCLADGASKSVTLDLSPGQTKEIEYRLKSSRSGSLFASAASSDSGAVGVSLQLLGGENYSPATLLMPWYARFLDQNFVNANLQLLGRGFGVATASLTSTMAGSPRVIKTDVFMRAIDIARAGQRSFITDSESDPAGTRAGKRFAYSNLALDLLGARDGRRREGEAVEHRNALQEWDALRRMESENNRSGRTAGAALALQLESTLEPGESPTQAFDRFVAAGAHRSDFVVALVTRGNARLGFVSPSGATVGANVTGAHPYSRRVPFADIHRLRMPDATDAELGIIGHSTTNVEVVISADGPVDLELVFPGGDLGAPLRVSRSFSSVGSHTYTLRIANGVARIDGHDETGLPLTITSAAPLAVPPIEVLAARQDLYLDTEGHKVSLLFNRPVLAGDGELFRKFGGEVVFADGSHSYRGPRPISAAALQEDGRVVNLTFDHALHANVAKRPGCAYSIAPAGMLSDPIEGAGVTSYSIPAARIDNARPAALLYGQVIAGDGMPITGADVVLYSGPPQYDRSNASAGTAQLGSFFFEYVPRDPQNGYSGAFTLEAITTEGKSTSTSGTIRTPGAVYAIDLQFLGRGSAEGYVRYDDSNAAVAGARVVVGSRMFNQFRTTTTDTSGFYRVTDVPVGPLTFSATDAEGNVVYAAGEIAASGQVVERNLLIHRQPFPGVGAVRGIVRRSDGQNDPVPGAHVGVYSQGYGLIDGYTDADGRFEFTAVPAGSVSVLAEEWTVAYESAAIELDLRADETREVTLIIPVRNTSVALGRVEGVVTRGDAGVIGARPVPGAVVQIDGFPAVTADASGRFTFESVPLTFSTRRVRAWDPESGRIGESHLPTLRSDATNNAPIFIPAASGAGRGTVRVLLLDAGGAPVSSDEYKVLLTGYPVVELRPESETGVFTVVDVPVGTTVEFAAVPRTASGRYGEQFVSGSASVDIDQQIVSRTLRLPGQGQVLVSLQSAGTKQLGDVRLEFRAWSEAEQDIAEKVVLASTQDPPGSGIPGYARFARVPAQQTVTVSADLAAQGSASQALRLAWDGQVLQSDLQLGTRARVRGRVLHFDGLTPIVGASVAIVDGLQDSGVQVTGEHGSFEFADVPPGIDFRLTASWYENDVYRTGVAGGRTPELGGLVEGLVITLRRQANVEGRIVFADRKVDPADPSRMVPDDTPGDYSDNAPVARGSFWLTELDFPNRSFGSQGSPLRADLEGNFVVANVFEGSFRVTASNLDQSASVSGRIDLDGVSVTALLAVGAEGSGTIDVRVVDPDRAYVAVPNAEITLYRNGEAFDFGSSDGAGNARFGELPATGSYQVGVYSKALGRSGASDAFTIQPGVGRIVEVALERSGTVAGTLTDSAYSGEGVVGAHVSLTGMGYGTRTTTADGGAFEFDGVREGLFRLETRDPLSNRRAYGQGEISQGQPRDTVDLQLPRWSSLRVNTWLPDDYGARSSTPAGSVAVDVRQLCYFSQGDGALICEELRSLQGASLLFDRVLPDADYLADVREIGGSGRKVSLSGRLNEGESKQHDVVLPAFGRVNVRVLNRDTRAPMENVRVQVSSEGTNFVGYTDSSGSVLAGSFILNREVSVGAATVDGRLSGSTRVTILRSSVPADATIELASYATISGYVEAEEGGPSIGTRVVAQGSAETVTDGAGRFGIAGLVTGTSINLVYLGPDGLTVGARQQFTPAVPGVNLVPSVRLDATPPRIVAVNPVDGAAEVSLDTRVEVVFSEPIAPAYHSATYFQLAPNGTGTGTGVAFSTFTEARGFVVTLIPSQKLASHTLYRLLISGSVADMSGHAVGAPREVSFTTSDRTEPQILRVSPDASRPIPANSLFEVELNEALNSLDWQAGGSGRMTLSKLAGMPSAPVATIDGVVWLDEPTHRTLRFSPSTLLEAASTYRLELSGVRDLQGNLLAAQAFDFATADAVKPHISIATPSPAEALVGGLLYTTGLVLRDGDANGPAAEDIDRVEYFQRSGDTWQLAQIVRRTAGNPNCSYSFVVPTSSPSFALRAVAFDTSFNESLPAEVAWEVVADEAPRNVNIVTKIGGMLSASAHAGSPVVANLTFEEEGFVATYTIRAVATKDGQPLFASAPQSAEMRRAPGDGWSTVTYEFVLPKTLPAGTIVTVGATVNDSSNRAGTGEATISILEDSGKPAVVLVSEPAPGGSVSDGGIVRVRATGADVEVGVATVRAILGARTVSLTRVGSGDEFAGEIIAPDVSGVEAVPFDLGVEAEDYAGNVSARTVVPLTVTPVYDPTDPVISFVCGTDGAVLPVGVSFSVLVDVKPGAAAGSDPANAISSVVFRVNGDERRLDPSASNRYSTSISTVGMADGSVVRVEVEARTSGTGSGARAWEIPVVEAVDLTGHVIEADDPRYESRSIFVNGGSLTIIGRHTFANVIVLGGAMPSSVKTNPASLLEFSSSNVYVGCGASIDVDDLGSEPVPLDGSPGSYGGYGAGGQRSTYGSLVKPRSFGNGGGVNPVFRGLPQNNAGGAVSLTAARFVLDGQLRANGSDTHGDAGGGSGGSVHLQVGDLVLGLDGAIAANGARGGGGGRVAVHATNSIQASYAQIAARGNGAISGEPNSDRGSAGTVYVREGQTESLVIDNGGVLSTLVASLPTPGTVEVGSTAWPEVSLTTSTPAWIEGARVECSVGGSLVGDWRIADRPDATRLLLEGDAPASPLTGASCRGYWKFDRVIVRNGGRYRVPLLRTSLLEGTADGLIDTTDLEGDAIVAAGNARVSGRVDADSLTITSGRTFEAAGTIEVGSLYVAQGARLVQRQTPVTATALTYPGLDLRVGNTITVDGTISATGSGFRGSAGHLGRTWWGIAASYLGAGGSFGGRGGDAGSSALAGAVYGSVSNPREPGAAGAEAGWPYGGAECDLPECAAGGGVISIKAANLVLNGSIESRGQSVLPSPSPYASQSGSGSGGSISIDVTALSGSGSIRADGGPRNAPGGGGRVAVRSGSSPTGNILAAGGAGGAAAGTIVTFRKGSSVFGDLVVDNANLDAPAATELPSLGSGVAESGSGGGVIVTDRSSIPPWNVGRFVEVRTSSGSLKGIWQIVGVDGATIALESGANVSPGDRWQAVYRFDSVTVRRAGRLASVDPVLAPGYGPPDGTLSLAGGQPVEVLGGSTIKVVVNGTDAQSLQRVILRANGPVTGASVTQARNVTGTSTTQPFDVGVLATAQEGAVVRIVAEIVDEIGTVVVTEELAFTVLRDEIPPTISSVTIEPFVTDSRYASGTPLNISVVASDNVGVASVSAEIMGSSMADGVPPYQYAWLVPKTVADTPVDIVITVLDTKGHATRETRSITIVPAAGGTAPVVAWTWPSAAATVPAGHPLRLGVTAVDDSGVVRLEIFEEDATLPIHTFDSSSFSTTSLATEATALLPAQPGSRTFRVRAHDISPVYSESTIRVESVAAVLIDAVNPDWVALQSAPGVLASGTLTVNDPKRLAGLYVLSGATVTHASYESSHDNKAVDLVVAGDVWIERGGGIDVTGRGFRAGTSYPGATTPGLGSGGSHVGHGGLWNTPASTSFGSVYRPMEAGAGGGESGSDGGGVIRLQADRVVVDGAIQADGTLSFRSGGAGGSIWITAREFGGRGELSARNLGVANYGGGGGGAIAIDYDALTGSTPPAVSAAGGASLRRLPGSAGSIVQRVGTSRYGVLKADNGGVTATTTLPSLGSGFAASGSGGAHLETGSAVAVPPYFAGHWIEIRTAGGELKGRWRVKQVVGFGVDLEPNGSEAIDVQVGDAWQGVYVFSAVETSGGASLSSTDPIRIDTSVRD